MGKRRQEEKGILMDGNQKKYAIDDDALDEVSGGVFNGNSSVSHTTWECFGPKGCGFKWTAVSGETPAGCTKCGNTEIREL